MTSEGAATSKALVIIHSPATTTTTLTVADPHPPPPPPPPRKKKKYFSAPVKYMECLKNHAASIGGTATDGCGEFIAGGKEGTLEALICCACNCHRNFHRKIPLQLTQPPPQPEAVDVRRRKDEEGGGAPPPPPRKRFRSKFSQEQREKMQSFAEKSGWKLQKVGDAEVRSFCEEIGVKRKVLKVWMHNNKYQFANKIIN